MRYQEHAKDPGRIEAERLVNLLKLKDDKEFVFKQLGRFPSKEWLPIFREYIEHWRSGVNEQPDENKKQNSGRYRANVWLLTK